MSKRHLFAVFVIFLSSAHVARADQIKQIGIGSLHACALMTSNRVKCWGNGAALGYGDRRNRGGAPGDMGEFLPYVDLGADFHVQTISVSDQFACALSTDGTVKCWGNGSSNGILGYEDTQDRGDDPMEMGESLPLVNLGAGQKVVQFVTAGGAYGHNCARFENGLVKCWGRAYLGYGDENQRGFTPGTMGDQLPFLDLDADHAVADLALGRTHTCALFDHHKVKCWGNNGSGQLGYGDTMDRGNQPSQMGPNLPYIDFGDAPPVIGLAAGVHHTCALFENHKVKCWGGNSHGQLGYGDTIARNVPGPYLDLGTDEPVAAILSSSRSNHTCALLANGKAKCWGYSDIHDLRIGDEPGEMLSQLIDLPFQLPITQLTMSTNWKCVLFSNQGLRCWGLNTYGQLGYEDSAPRQGLLVGEHLNFVDLGL